MKTLFVATGNRGKAKEIRELLHGLVEIETLHERPDLVMPEEVGETFAENARAKAEHAARSLGVPALADDSGLVVDALGGAPGVKSARYAEGSDFDRVNKLLAALQGVPRRKRTARFVCAAAFSVPGRATEIREGRVEGIIAESPRGGGGFGYDPVFEVEGGAETMAELESAAKNVISHRGRALLALRPILAAHFSLVL